MALSSAERNRKYFEAHPDRIAAKYAKRNERRRSPEERQKANERSRAWWAAHPDKKAEKARKYAAKHGDHIRAYRRKRCDDRRAKLDALKDKPCVDCGQSFPPCVMDFDHVRGAKSRCVGNLFNVSEARLMAEIDKCDLVCSNCHRIRTAARRAAKQKQQAA